MEETEEDDDDDESDVSTLVDSDPTLRSYGSFPSSGSSTRPSRGSYPGSDYSGSSLSDMSFEGDDDVFESDDEGNRYVEADLLLVFFCCSFFGGMLMINQ